MAHSGDASDLYISPPSNIHLDYSPIDNLSNF